MKCITINHDGVAPFGIIFAAKEHLKAGSVVAISTVGMRAQFFWSIGTVIHAFISGKLPKASKDGLADNFRGKP